MDFDLPVGRTTIVSVDPAVEVLPDYQTPYVQDTSEDADKLVLKFGLPKGTKGDKGDPGDQNIYVGCEPPTDPNLIWYDPCENAINGVPSDIIIYEAYQHAGGTADKETFERALSKITTFGGGFGPSGDYYTKEEVDLKLASLETKVNIILDNLN